MSPSMQKTTGRYRWIEFKARPKRDGLHDSGFRYILVRGARQEKDDVVFDDLHRRADHVVFYGPTNTDVTPAGEIRVMPWSGKEWVLRDSGDPRFFGSDAIFYPDDWATTISLLRTYSEMNL